MSIKDKINVLISKLLIFMRKIIGKEKINSNIYTREFSNPYGYDSIIKDWQQRQREFTGNTPQQGDIDITKIPDVALNMRRNIEYITDIEQYGVKDYWPTSEEVKGTMKDDCDGQAIYAWSLLREAGFPDYAIGLVSVNGHLVACIHVTESDFYFIGNGFITNETLVKASDIFPIIIDGKYRYPIFGFNPFSSWVYKN